MGCDIPRWVPSGFQVCYPKSGKPHEECTISHFSSIIILMASTPSLATLQGMKLGLTISSYCATLTRLREAIRRKRPGMLSENVILLHDNTKPHIAQRLMKCLSRIQLYSDSPVKSFPETWLNVDRDLISTKTGLTSWFSVLINS
ncbi:hypothetical protein TNCV_4796101 [Trichonephila clavipes]|nr:hypothetical protein TNCV_4796101 [Trichonephila clavipes]